MSKELTLLGGRGSLRHYNLPEGVRFTRTSLVLPERLLPEQWAEVGDYLAAAMKASGVWLGDWARHGRANYDAQFVAVTLGQLDLPLHGMERFELQAQVAPEHRPGEFSKITPEHLLVVGKRLEDEEERRKWLSVAEEEGLSPRELQASIRAGKTLKLDMEKRRVDMPSPGAVRRAFDVWRSGLEGWDKVWTLKHCDLVVDELRPICAFVEEVLRRRDELRFAPAVENAKGKAGAVTSDE